MKRVNPYKMDHNNSSPSKPEYSPEQLQAVARLQNDAGFKIIINILETRQDLCMQQLLNADHTNLVQVQQLYHALGSVLECVQDATFALKALEQDQTDLNNLVWRHSQVG